MDSFKSLGQYLLKFNETETISKYLMVLVRD